MDVDKFLYIVQCSNTKVAAMGMRLVDVDEVAAFSSTFDVATCRRDALAFGYNRMNLVSRVCFTFKIFQK